MTVTLLSIICIAIYFLFKDALHRFLNHNDEDSLMEDGSIDIDKSDPFFNKRPYSMDLRNPHRSIFDD